MSKLGQGAFGSTFASYDLQSKKSVAIKIEYATVKKSVLRLEVVILKKLSQLNTDYFCHFYGCGKVRLPCPPTGEVMECNYLVMQRLGSNLSDLRKKQPESKFTLETMAILALQMLEGIQQLHQAGYIHRDIKPSNFVIGLEPSELQHPILRGKPKCYLIDFGLARRYMNTEGKLRETRKKVGFRGTVRYASISSHQSKELGRKDDLWSLFYVLIECTRGHLPWRKEKDREKIYKMKQEWNRKEMVKDLPDCFMKFYNHLLTLSINDEPNYNYLWNLFRQLLPEDLKDLVYDWDKKEDSQQETTETETQKEISVKPIPPKSMQSPFHQLTNRIRRIRFRPSSSGSNKV